MEHDVQAQNDQQDSQDELQAVGDEHSAPSGLTGRDGDSSGIADGLDHSDKALHQSSEGDAEHDDERGEEHLVAAAGDLQEDAQGRQDQSAQQLVCRTEQGPDVGVADLGQDEAEHQSEEGREVDVAEQLAPTLSVLHVVHAEQLLEAHAADAGHGIQAGQSQCGNAHGHKDGSGISGDTEHLKETGHAAAEDLEGSTGGGGAVSSGSSTGDAEGQNSQQALEDHGAIADLQHILLVLDGLGGSAGRDEAVEAGDRTAGHGDEQDGEHGTQLLVGETGEDGQVHGGVGDQQTDHSADDHGHEHEGGHVVTGLLQQPHGQDSGKEDVDEGDVAPCSLAQNEGQVRADDEGKHDENDADDALFPAGEVELLLDEAEDDSEDHEHDGDHTGSAVGLSSLRQSTVGAEGVEGTGDHVSKRCNDDAAEQPAEQQEQLAAGLADVLLDQHAHALAVVLDGSVQSAEVGDSAEEDAAQQHPQQDRQPAESSSLDSTGDRACTGNGAELVCKHGPAVGGDIVTAILVDDCGGLGSGVDAPLVGQPAAIQRISAEQTHGCDQNDDQRIHFFIPLSFLSHRQPAMCQTERLCPKAEQAKRPGGVKKASVLTKDRDAKMYLIFLEDEGQTVHLHRSFSAVPLRLLLSGAAACAYRRSCRRYAAL